MHKFNTNQAGHWYKCKNKTCNAIVPLPDKIFIENNYNGSFMAKCNCGHINIFMYSDAGTKTEKWEVDQYLGITDPNFKISFRGVGTTFTPVRLNAAPEITVLHLT
jgi:hypothetical protein